MSIEVASAVLPDLGACLLRHVLEAPGDDVPRLVYADWLEDNGQPERSEFIRVQVELEKLRQMTGSEPDYNPYRLWALIDAESRYDYERGVWLHQSWPGWPMSSSCCWSRGFVSRIELPAADFTEANARALFSCQPITEVVLAGKRPVQVGDGRWQWFCENWAPDPINLPYHLWQMVNPMQPGAVFGEWPTEPLALAALSAACVRWGRGLAGLPAWFPGLRGGA